MDSERVTLAEYLESKILPEKDPTKRVIKKTTGYWGEDFELSPVREDITPTNVGKCAFDYYKERGFKVVQCTPTGVTTLRNGNTALTVSLRYIWPEKPEDTTLTGTVLERDIS